MRDEVRRDREHSSAAFERVVWPIVQEHCPELRESALRLVEGRAKERIAYELDVCAGIDAYQRTPFGLRGIGSRIQWRRNYHTFTVRVSRPNGALTEYRKRLLTLKRCHEGFLYPYCGPSRRMSANQVGTGSCWPWTWPRRSNSTGTSNSARDEGDSAWNVRRGKVGNGFSLLNGENTGRAEIISLCIPHPIRDNSVSK